MTRSRWDDVVRWRDRLTQVDVSRDPGGLSPAGATEAWTAALDALHDDALATAAATPGRPHAHAVIVAARTVRTAPIELCAVLLGRGSTVTIKHPAGDPGWVPHLVAAATALDLPLTSTEDRQALTTADLVVAMGSDDSVRAVRAAAPVRAQVFAFGHRFSIVWLGDVCPAHAVFDAIAADAALHDGRGCFSPVAVFTPTDGRDVAAALSDALARAQARWPVGVVHPIEGAQIRARGALARVEGTSLSTPGGSVHLLPASRFEPIALPRAIAVHPVRDLAHALDVVRPWSRWLSSVAAQPHVAEPWLDLGATRVCAPGSLQRPALNRAHDGVDWVRAMARQTSG